MLHGFVPLVYVHGVAGILFKDQALTVVYTLLVSLLVLPLYTPVLIFGALAVSAHATGLDTEAHLSLLAAFLVLATIFGPWAAAAGLRISLD